MGVRERKLPREVRLEFILKRKVEVSPENGVLEGEPEQIFLEEGKSYKRAVLERTSCSLEHL